MAAPGDESGGQPGQSSGASRGVLKSLMHMNLLEHVSANDDSVCQIVNAHVYKRSIAVG